MADKKNSDTKDIRSTRFWEYIEYVLDKSSLSSKRDNILTIDITIEDYVWIMFVSFFDILDQELYEFLEEGSDKKSKEFQLNKIKCGLRFNKFWEACESAGIDKRAVLEILNTRCFAEFSILTDINKKIANMLQSISEDSISDEDDEENSQ